MTDFDKITVPRPKPHEAVIAVTDAEGASAWVTIQKTMFADFSDDFLAQLLPILADGQRLVHEQRESASA